MLAGFSLKQREALIHLLNKKGGMVDNPRVHYFDIKAESVRRRAAKIVGFFVAKKRCLRLIDKSTNRLIILR